MAWVLLGVAIWLIAGYIINAAYELSSQNVLADDVELLCWQYGYTGWVQTVSVQAAYLLAAALVPGAACYVVIRKLVAHA